MRKKNFKQIDTYNGWEKQYQKSMNSRKYNRKQRQLKNTIYQQLCQLNTPNIIKQHQSQIKKTVAIIDWFDACDGVDKLLFMSYSLTTSHSKDHLKKVKRIYHSQKKGNEHNFNFKKKQGYLNTHNTTDGYDYYLLNTDTMLEFLWNSPKTRIIIKTWLSGYLKIKRLYGAEAIESFLDSATGQNYFVYLLNGINQDDNHLYLPRYKRFSKQIITKQEWRATIKANIDVLGDFWD